jgi:hypothetical protein
VRIPRQASGTEEKATWQLTPTTKSTRSEQNRTPSRNKTLRTTSDTVGCLSPGAPVRSGRHVSMIRLKDGCVDFACAVTANPARTLRSPIPRLTTEFPTAAIAQTGRALENAASRIASRWTYTASVPRAVRNGSGAATDQAPRDRPSLGHRRTVIGGRPAPAHRTTRGCSTAALSSPETLGDRRPRPSGPPDSE